ncbi:hypothetical protein [Alkalilacustris brevis]|nr:hypothetical protein [Alkalilacustris brevis]
MWQWLRKADPALQLVVAIFALPLALGVLGLAGLGLWFLLLR